MCKFIIALFLAIITPATFAQSASEQLAGALGGLVGHVAGSLLVDGAVAAECGGKVAIDRKVTGRGHGRDSVYDRYADSSEYRECRREADRQIAENRRDQQREAAEARREARYAPTIYVVKGDAVVVVQQVRRPLGGCPYVWVETDRGLEQVIDCSGGRR